MCDASQPVRLRHRERVSAKGRRMAAANSVRVVGPHAEQLIGAELSPQLRMAPALRCLLVEGSTINRSPSTS
jgi:hypothetical protein